MNSALTYKLISKVYDLLDVFYFYNQSTSPRNAVYELTRNNNVKVLDICTGTAANAISIAKDNKEAKVVGIDLSKDMLKIAQKKVNQLNLDNVNLYTMDATKTDFKNSEFDVVLISLVLHELNKDLATQILLEAKRVLKEDGQIIVVEWEKPQQFLQKLMFFPIRKMEPKGFEDFLNLDLNKYFKQFGLSVVDIRHCDYSKVLQIKKDIINT